MIKPTSNYAGSKRLLAAHAPAHGVFKHKRLVQGMALACCLMRLSQTVSAGPEGAEVIAGEVAINQVNANQLNIHQTSDRAVVNYQDFSIASDEIVTIVQPGSDAVLLNRVVGDNLSEIHGELNANGQVFLVNPQGVMFGAGSQVNVGGLLVSTVDINSDAFMAGHTQVTEGTEARGRVINQGHIVARGEQGVVFVAPIVENNGHIEAIGGDISLSNGEGVFAQMDGSPISILLDSPDQRAAITNRGRLRVNQVEQQGGEIRLVSERGDVINTGSIDASAEGSRAAGDIILQAERVAQFGLVDASAQQQGGQVLVRGSRLVEIGSSSQSDVSGTDGDAGRAIFFSPDTTLMHAGAYIRASSESGQGGYVDVSGLEQVEAMGRVEVDSGRGQHGTFLIDPEDITITTVDNLVTASSPFQASGSGASTVSVATIEAALNGGGAVQIRTDADFGDAEGGNIAVNSSIDLDGSHGGTLTLVADANITFTGGVTIQDQNTGTADDTNIVMTAGGSVSMQDTNVVNAGSGTIAITAGGNIQVGSLVTANASSNAIDLAGVAILDAGDTYIDLIAQNGGAEINAATQVGSASFIETDLSEISITMGGAAPVRILELDDLELVNITNGLNVDVWAGGTLTIRDPGLTAAGDVNIMAADITGDAGRTLSLTANRLEMDITSTGALTTLNTNVNELDVSVGGAGVDITNAGALSLLDGVWDADTSPVEVSGSYLAVRTATGDVTVNSNIDLDGANGATLILDAAGELVLPVATQISDQTLGTTDNVALELRSGGNLTLDSSVNIDVGGGTVLANSGGDLTVSGLVSTSAASTALQLTAAGAILDAGDGSTDLTATSGGIVLAAGTGVADLEIEAATLDVTNSTSGAVILHQQNSANLTLSGLDTAADFSLDGVTNLTITDAANRVAGDLSIATVGTGSLVIPEAGLNTIGSVTVNTWDIADSDNSVVVNGASGDLTFRGLATATALNTNFSDLSVSSATATPLSFINSAALNVNSFVGTGDRSISTTAGDLVFTANLDTDGSDGATWTFNAANNLSIATATSWQDSNTGTADNINLVLTAGADLLASDINAIHVGNGTVLINTTTQARITGLTTTSASASAVVINASRVRGNTSQATDISALNGGVIFNTTNGVVGGIGAYFDVNTPSLEVNLTGTGNTHIDTDGDIELSGTGFSHLDLRSSGTLTLPETGLVATGSVILRGTDLLDTAGRSLDISTNDLYLEFSALTGDLILNTNTPALDGRLAGTGNVTINTTGNVSLTDHTEDVNSLGMIVSSGDFTLTSTGDISLDAPLDTNSLDGLTTRFIASNDILFAAGHTLADSDATVADAITVDLQADRHISLAVGSRIDSNAGTIRLAANSNSDGTGAVSLLGQLISTNTSANAIDIIAAAIVGDGTAQTEFEATGGGIQLAALDGMSLLQMEASHLSLANTVSGAVTIEQQNNADLTLNALNTVGNFTLSGTRHVTLTDAAHSVGGDLTITTNGVGNLIVPETGLTSSGVLTVNVNELSDSNSTVILSGSDGSLTFRNLVTPTLLTTDFATLDISSVSATPLSLTNSAALSVGVLSAGGDVDISTSVGDLTFSSAIDLEGTHGARWQFSAADSMHFNPASLWQDGNTATLDDIDIQYSAANDITMSEGSVVNVGGGTLNLNAGGTIFVASLQSTNTSSNALTLTSNMIRDNGDVDLDLIAPNGGAVLSADVEIGRVDFIETELGELDISLVAPGEVRIVELDHLTLTNLTNGFDVDMWVPGGTLTVPGAGLNVTGELSVFSQDITSLGGRTFAAAATHAFFDINALAAPTTINSSFSRLDINVSGDSLNIVNGGALELADYAADANTDALTMSAANVLVSTAVGDLTLASNVNLDGANGSTLHLNAAENIVLGAGMGIQDQTLASPDNVTVQLSSGNNITLVDTNVIDVAGGTAELNAGNNMTLTGVSSTHTSATALTLTAGGSILDAGDSSVDVSAINGGISFQAATGIDDLEIETASASVTNSVSGAVVLHQQNTANLTLTTLNTAGDFSLGGVNNLTLLDTAASLGGDASVTTAANGELILPNTGLTVVGVLTLDVFDITDSDSTISLNGASADLTFRGIDSATHINSNFSDLALTSATAMPLSITNSGALNVNAMSTVGDLTFTTTAGNLDFTAGLDTDDSDGAHWVFTSAADLQLTDGTGWQDSNTTTTDNIHLTLTSSGDILASGITALFMGAGNVQLNSVGETRITRLISSSSAANAIEINAANVVGDNSDASDISALAGGVIFNTESGVLGASNEYFDVNAPAITLNQTAAGTSRIDIEVDSMLTSTGLSDIYLRSMANLTLEDAGLISSGNAALWASDLRDESGRDVLIRGEDVYVELSGLTDDITLNVDATNLDATIDGTGDVAFIVPGNITLFDSVEDTQTHSVMARSGDLTVSAGADIIVSSDLRLNDQANQNLNLVAANDIVFTGMAAILDSSGANLNGMGVSLTSGRHIQLADATVINSYNGVLTLTANQNGDGVGDINVFGQLISNSNIDSAVQLNAVNVTGDGTAGIEVDVIGGGLVLNATGAISGTGGAYFNTNAERLSVGNVNGDLNLHASRDMQLLTATNLTDVDLRVNGDLTIADSGLQSSSGLLAIEADDVIDSDRTVFIDAEQLLLQLQAPTADTTLNTNVTRADISTSNHTLTLNELNSLVLQDLNGDNAALTVSDGNAYLNIASGDLQVVDDMYLEDTQADGVRAGLLDIVVSSGNIDVGTTRDVTIQSINTVDQNALGGVGSGFMGNPSQTALRFELENNAGLTRTISLGSATSNATVLAVGGDIEIDGLGRGVAGTTSSSVVQLALASQIETYNTVTDAVDGTLLLNGVSSNSEGNRIARTGRILSLRPDSVFTPEPEPEPEPQPEPELSLPEEDVSVVVNDTEQNVNSGALEQPAPEDQSDAKESFDQVYSAVDCASPNEKNKGACNIEAAVKNFLSHWTVGGQLPPKVNKH